MNATSPRARGEVAACRKAKLSDVDFSPRAWGSAGVLPFEFAHPILLPARVGKCLTRRIHTRAGKRGRARDSW